MVGYLFSGYWLLRGCLVSYGVVVVAVVVALYRSQQQRRALQQRFDVLGFRRTERDGKKALQTFSADRLGRKKVKQTFVE
jgi:hypothetical protein